MRSAAIVLALFANVAVCQYECAYPTISDLEHVLQSVLLQANSSNSTLPDVNILDINPVCLAYGIERDRFRSVSVIVQYTCIGNSSCTALEQIEPECVDGTWSDPSFEFQTTTTMANMSTIAREDCAYCQPPQLQVDIMVDPITHCLCKSRTGIVIQSLHYAIYSRAHISHYMKCNTVMTIPSAWCYNKLFNVVVAFFPF